MSTTAETEKVTELIKDSRFAMLTTLDRGKGRIVSRPMAVQQVEDDGTVWFFASDESPKADQLAVDPAVNLAFQSSSSWVSLAGRATIVEDKAKIQELWNKGVEAWFPDGPDGDDVALLRVDPDSAEYWDSPGGRVASVIAYAKAKATGERPSDIGENEVVEL
jgi:general stress protein 26